MLLLLTLESIARPADIAPMNSADTISEEATQNNQELLTKKLAEQSALQQDVTRLRRLCRQVNQIVLKFRMIEISRTRLRQLQHERDGPDAALVEQLLALQPSGVIEDMPKFELLLRRLGKDGIKALAEPNLTAYVGQPAAFNSGGEFPIIVAPGTGGVSVQHKKHGMINLAYKKFGTEAGVTAFSMDDQQARFHLRFRCSEVDDTHSIKVQGVGIPSLRVCEVQTEVEAPLGQATFVHATTGERSTSLEKRDGNRVTSAVQREDVIRLVFVTPLAVETIP